MFLVDFEQGRLIPDEELKNEFANRRPYGEWLASQRIELDDLRADTRAARLRAATRCSQRMQAFGYTVETMQFMLLPLVAREARSGRLDGQRLRRSPCLTDKPRMLYDYFKQLFAQVTNPPIDSIREEVIMSLECYIGPEAQPAGDARREHAHRLRLPHPILTNEELAGAQAPRPSRLEDADDRHHLRPQAEGEAGLHRGARPHLRAKPSRRSTRAISLVVLSDRAIGPTACRSARCSPCGAVHHHLVRTGQAHADRHRARDRRSPRGASPLPAGRLRRRRDQSVPGVRSAVAGAARRPAAGREYADDDRSSHAYRKAVAKGMLKVMAKMGISTLQSYKGAQIFEAVGLARRGDRALLRRHGQPHPRRRFRRAGRGSAAAPRARLSRSEPSDRLPVLPNPGEFHWRADGERHMWDPQAIADLQVAAPRQQRRRLQAVRRARQRGRAHARARLRGLLEVQDRRERQPIPLDEVEPAKRDRQAVLHRRDELRLDLGRGPRDAGHRHEPHRRQEQHGRRRRRPGAVQAAAERRLASARRSSRSRRAASASRSGTWPTPTSCRSRWRRAPSPAKAASCPASKVDDNIARIRYSTPGVGLISPPPHHDIYSIEDLKQLIHDLKNTQPVGARQREAGVAKSASARSPPAWPRRTPTTS